LGLYAAKKYDEKVSAPNHINYENLLRHAAFDSVSIPSCNATIRLDISKILPQEFVLLEGKIKKTRTSVEPTV